MESVQKIAWGSKELWRFRNFVRFSSFAKSNVREFLFFSHWILFMLRNFIFALHVSEYIFHKFYFTFLWTIFLYTPFFLLLLLFLPLSLRSWKLLTKIANVLSVHVSTLLPPIFDTPVPSCTFFEFAPHHVSHISLQCLSQI